jgi:hypothetical protein
MVCEYFTKHEGQWDKIMKEKRIKKLGFSREFFAIHLSNKKKRVRRLSRQNEEQKKRKFETVIDNDDDVELRRVYEDNKRRSKWKTLPEERDEREELVELRESLRAMNARYEALEMKMNSRK